MNYYPHHIGDYLRDTAHLSLVEHGAYRRMLDVYYATERPLPRSQEQICRIVGAKSRVEKLAVGVVLGEFWVESPDGWRNQRADAEIARAQDKAEKARTSAGMRWHSDRNANAVRPQSEGNAPNNQKPITKEKSRARGARLHLDWSPSPELLAWSMAKRHDLDITETVAKFKDHWQAAAGASATKLNWDATFRNWVRNEKQGKPGVVVVAAKPRICAYCPKPSIGNVGGIQHCDEHSLDAMDRKPFAKVAA